MEEKEASVIVPVRTIYSFYFLSLRTKVQHGNDLKSKPELQVFECL